jgi:hypothetical protein
MRTDTLYYTHTATRRLRVGPPSASPVGGTRQIEVLVDADAVAKRGPRW